MTDHGFDPDARLAEREARDLRRDLEPAETVHARTRFAPDPKADAPDFGGTPDDGRPPDDQSALVFAANDYLGLATDDRLQRAAELGARTVGTGAGASRLVTGDTALHRALERDLAGFKGTERALVFSSGYAANVGTIEALDPDVVFSDALNHASVVDGCRLSGAETVVYDHCDADDLARAMGERATADGTGGEDESWLVVTDGVFSMDGDVAPLEAICDVADERGAWVMVDDAHGTGVLGEAGAGLVRRRGLTDRVDVQVGTCSKALGSQGGFVAGDEALVEYLANAARSFVFSTGLAPPAAAAAREGLRIARESDRRRDLHRIAERMRDELTGMGFEVLGETHVLPVLVGDRTDALALEDALRDRGVVAPAIRPPTVPEGRSRVRVSPRATHTEEDLERCLRAFREARREVSLA